MRKILRIFLIFIGICLILYPFVGDYFFKNKQLKDIEKYEQDINESSEEEIEQMKKNYINYNGIIGYIEIPKIDLKLGIYPDTEEKHLLNGAGVFEDSLPVYNNSTYHLVLVGHTGITAKILFDNINKLSIDDEFYVQVFNDKYKYKVCEINTILPNETQKLFSNIDEKFTSLVTCTPKYINTHRLVVTGKEVKFP